MKSITFNLNLSIDISLSNGFPILNFINLLPSAKNLVVCYQQEYHAAAKFDPGTFHWDVHIKYI